MMCVSVSVIVFRAEKLCCVYLGKNVIKRAVNMGYFFKFCVDNCMRLKNSFIHSFIRVFVQFSAYVKFVKIRQTTPSSASFSYI
jgi:hypothetical protein